MKNFFVDEDLTVGQEFYASGDLHHYICHVLRFEVGKTLNLLDGKGNSYQGKLVSFDKKRALIYLENKKEMNTEPQLKIDLFQALPKGTRFENVLEKGCELGFRAFTPLDTLRTIKSVDKQGTSKYRRWEKILTSAAQQAGRAIVPGLNPPCQLEALASLINNYSLGLVAWEKSQKGIKEILEFKQDLESIMLIIGPEGGFADEEIELLREWNIYDFSLGPRILRSDTAGLVAGSILFYHYGSMEV